MRPSSRGAPINFLCITMITMHKRITIQTLLKLGHKKQNIADEMGCHRNTISNIAKEDPIKDQISKGSQSHSLDKHKDYIQDKINKELSLVRIHQDLSSEKQLKQSYDSLRRYVKTRGLKPIKAYVVINTEPGQEAQVDFGHVGLQFDASGKLRKSYVFVMTLGFSRKAFHKTVYNQKVETFIQCHIDAFTYFGGIPTTVKIDNLKAAVLQANFYEPEYQKQYLAFSQYYGFTIYPCKVRNPEEKGKVESGVKYVKNNFFKGRQFKSGKELAEKLSHWQEEICNKRMHGTTKKIPAVQFKELEQQELKPLPEKPWEIYSMEKRKVGATCHIMVDNNYYSVPYKYIGNNVDVKITENIIKIYHQNLTVATHSRLISNKGEYQTNSAHYPEYKAIDRTELQYGKELRMKDIGENAHQFFLKLLEIHPDNWNRRINGILSLVKQYDKEVINLACARALAFEVITYQAVVNICRKRLYLEKADHLLIAQNIEQDAEQRNCEQDMEQNTKQNTGESKLQRPLSYYAQILLNFFLILWNFYLNSAT